MLPTFTLFGRTIGLYPLFGVLGVFAAGIYACRAAKKQGYDDNDMIVLLLISAIGVLLGSHLLYGLTNFQLMVDFFTGLPKLGSFREFIQGAILVFGGSVYYGGLIGGMAAGALYIRHRKFSFPVCTDLIAPAVPLFHVFGRIGCFMGGCCYGVACKWGITYHNALTPDANGVARFPVQLVEAVFNLGLFFALDALRRRGKFQGKLFCLYLIAYSIGRFILEFWRGDAIRGFVLGLSTSQFISILLLVGTLVFMGAKGLLRRPNQAPKF